MMSGNLNNLLESEAHFNLCRFSAVTELCSLLNSLVRICFICFYFLLSILLHLDIDIQTASISSPRITLLICILFSLPSISISTSVYSLLLFVSFSVDIYIYLSVPTSSSVSRSLSLSLLYAYFQLLWRHNSVTQQSFGFIQCMEGTSNAARLLTDT